MKKALVVFGVFAVISLASCKKEKECTCVVNVNGVDMSTTKVKTKESCSSLNVEQSSAGLVSKTTCN